MPSPTSCLLSLNLPTTNDEYTHHETFKFVFLSLKVARLDDKAMDVQLAVLILAGGLFGILLIALWSN